MTQRTPPTPLPNLFPHSTIQESLSTTIENNTKTRLFQRIFTAPSVFEEFYLSAITHNEASYTFEDYPPVSDSLPQTAPHNHSSLPSSTNTHSSILLDSFVLFYLGNTLV